MPNDLVTIGDLRNKMSETEFQAWVISVAKQSGWKHFHTYNSRRSVGGFPDLFLVNVKRDISLFVELKTATGKVRIEQRHWLTELRAVGQIACVWRPAQIDEIAEFLTEYKHSGALPPGLED